MFLKFFSSCFMEHLNFTNRSFYKILSFHLQVTNGWCHVWECCTLARVYSTGWYRLIKVSAAVENHQAHRLQNTPGCLGFDCGGVVHGWRFWSTTDYQRFTEDQLSCKVAIAISSGRRCWRKRTLSKFSSVIFFMSNLHGQMNPQVDKLEKSHLQ